MTIFVFGNPDLENDSLPLRLLPKLRQEFPALEFKALDPNEEWNLPKEVMVLDSVLGIKEPKVFNCLEEFSQTPRMTMHDFDALTNLRYLKKLGKIRKIKIIGLPASPSGGPPMITPEQALKFLRTIFLSNQP